MLMARAILKAFNSRQKGIEITRKRVERLFRSGNINRRDMEMVYEAIFIRSVIAFENFCEKLFFGILEGTAKHKNKAVCPLIKSKSKKALRKIILAKKSYVNWIPYSETEARANLYLDGGLPFTTLDANQKKIIATIIYIRNAIAHRSKHAMKVFKKEVVKNYPTLLPIERSPAGFLRSNVAGGITRFQDYIENLTRFSDQLCK
jgi:hypothetical protein